MTTANTKNKFCDILLRNYDPLTIEEIFFLKAFVQSKPCHVRRLVDVYIHERMAFPYEFRENIFLEEVDSRTRLSTSWKVPRMDSIDEGFGYDDFRTDYIARNFITPEVSLPPEMWHQVVNTQPTLTGIEHEDGSL